MRTLHEIGADLEALEQLLTDVDGEIPEGEIGAVIEAWFDSLGAERDEKIRRYCALIELLGLAADDCAEVIRRIGRLQRANANGAERLKSRLKVFFEEHDIPKLDLGIFRPRIQQNGGVRPLDFPEAWEKEPASSPERYHKPVITLNKELLREDAEATEVELSNLRADLAAGKITPQEYEDALHVAESTNPVRFAPRGTHLRLR